MADDVIFAPPRRIAASALAEIQEREFPRSPAMLLFPARSRRFWKSVHEKSPGDWRRSVQWTFQQKAMRRQLLRRHQRPWTSPPSRSPGFVKNKLTGRCRRSFSTAWLRPGAPDPEAVEKCVQSSKFAWSGFVDAAKAAWIGGTQLLTYGELLPAGTQKALAV
ncbi:unnamed protein product [Durusdinium trenchii]